MSQADIVTAFINQQQQLQQLSNNGQFFQSPPPHLLPAFDSLTNPPRFIMQGDNQSLLSAIPLTVPFPSISSASIINENEPQFITVLNPRYKIVSNFPQLPHAFPYHMPRECPPQIAQVYTPTHAMSSPALYSTGTSFELSAMQQQHHAMLVQHQHYMAFQQQMASQQMLFGVAPYPSFYPQIPVSQSSSMFMSPYQQHLQTAFNTLQPVTPPSLTFQDTVNNNVAPTANVLGMLPLSSGDGATPTGNSVNKNNTHRRRRKLPSSATVPPQSSLMSLQFDSATETDNNAKLQFNGDATVDINSTLSSTAKTLSCSTPTRFDIIPSKLMVHCPIDIVGRVIENTPLPTAPALTAASKPSLFDKARAVLGTAIIGSSNILPPPLVQDTPRTVAASSYNHTPQSGSKGILGITTSDVKSVRHVLSEWFFEPYQVMLVPRIRHTSGVNTSVTTIAPPAPYRSWIDKMGRPCIRVRGTVVQDPLTQETATLSSQPWISTQLTCRISARVVATLSYALTVLNIKRSEIELMRFHQHFRESGNIVVQKCEEASDVTFYIESSEYELYGETDHQAAARHFSDPVLLRLLAAGLPDNWEQLFKALFESMATGSSGMNTGLALSNIGPVVKDIVSDITKPNMSAGVDETATGGTRSIEYSYNADGVLEPYMVVRVKLEPNTNGNACSPTKPSPLVPPSVHVASPNRDPTVSLKIAAMDPTQTLSVVSPLKISHNTDGISGLGSNVSLVRHSSLRKASVPVSVSSHSARAAVRLAFASSVLPHQPSAEEKSAAPCDQPVSLRNDTPRSKSQSAFPKSRVSSVPASPASALLDLPLSVIDLTMADPSLPASDLKSASAKIVHPSLSGSKRSQIGDNVLLLATVDVLNKERQRRRSSRNTHQSLENKLISSEHSTQMNDLRTLEVDVGRVHSNDKKKSVTAATRVTAHLDEAVVPHQSALMMLMCSEIDVKLDEFVASHNSRRLDSKLEHSDSKLEHVVIAAISSTVSAKRKSVPVDSRTDISQRFKHLRKSDSINVLKHEIVADCPVRTPVSRLLSLALSSPTVAPIAAPSIQTSSLRRQTLASVPEDLNEDVSELLNNVMAIKSNIVQKRTSSTLLRQGRNTPQNGYDSLETRRVLTESRRLMDLNP